MEDNLNLSDAEIMQEDNSLQKEDLQEEIKNEDVNQSENMSKEEKNVEQNEDISEKEMPSEQEIEEEIEIPDDAYDNLTKEEVVSTLEDIVKDTDVNRIKKQVSLLKIRFLQFIKEEKERFLQKDLSQEDVLEESPEETEKRKELENRFNEAFNKYKENKQNFVEEQEKVKINNLEEKKKLLEELKLLIESNESLKKIYDEFKEIQEKWKAIGAVPQADIAELWQNYHFYVEKFFDKVKINKELKELDLKKNLEQKIELCEKAEALLLEDSIFKAFTSLQQLHNQWKEIGPVSEDKKEEIWVRFKTASDLINQKRKEYYENIAQEQEDNYKAKIALCDKVSEVTNIAFSSLKLINEASKSASELLETWKTIGPAPKQHNDEVWNRFKSIIDTFFESKKQYLKKLKEEQVDNYNKKINLCIQAEAIALRKDFKKATDDLLRLQKEWKEIGFVARKQSDVVWQRFRKACDDFFTAKKEYFANLEQNESDNLAKKEALVQKVKDTPLVESKEENLQIIKDFQREWTDIGYIPAKEKDRLWKEFRAAIDKRFSDLKMNEEEIKKLNYQEKLKNLLSDENSMEAIRKERRFLQTKIAKLTEDVTLWENNLGFFAHSKNADLLKKQFEKKISDARAEIKQLESKLTLLKEETKSENK